jgi:S1-C subfamily serine protease
MYENGMGVSQDYAQAEKWYSRAASHFSESDADNRDKAAKDRDRIAAILSPSQAAPQPPIASQQMLKIAATGSGFYLSNVALLLTNYHVVDGCKAVSIPRGTASIVAVDPANDLALVSVPPRSGGIASLRTSPAIRAGERVVAVGFPLTGYLAEQANVTTGDVSSLAGIRNDSRYMQITAPVQLGNSGGPLFDAAGNVIGVVSAKIDAIKVAGITGDIPENVNFALNVSVVRTFLDSHGVIYLTAVSTGERPVPDIGDRGKSITELVECWQ